MTVFQTVADELAETQLATEELLQEVAAATTIQPSEHTLNRLHKLANTCARLAYLNDLTLSSNVHNLIAWCDHLDDADWKNQFVSALKNYPLRSPW